MNAKEVAQSINQAAEQAGLGEKWEELKRRILAAQANEELAPFSRQVLQQALDVTRGPAQAYLTFLSQDLGTKLNAKTGGKAASFKALVISADQAWRAFHHRLNDASKHVIEADALKNALRQSFPGVYAIGWGNVETARVGALLAGVGGVPGGSRSRP